MTESARLFVGRVPELYDRFMGPYIFEPFTEPVSSRIAAFQPARVLEVAAGTGLLTEGLVRALPDAVIIATDLNGPMIDYAAGMRDAPGVVWEVADANSLPYPDGAFDLVVCQFGAMFFPDRPRAYTEARRALTADGTLVLVIWDSLATNDFPRVVADTMNRLLDDEGPSFIERIPHGYHDVAEIRADLMAAGYTRVDVETVAVNSVAFADDLSHGFVEGTPMRAEIEARLSGGFERAANAVRDALIVECGTGQTNQISGKLTAFVVTARP